LLWPPLIMPLTRISIDMALALVDTGSWVCRESREAFGKLAQVDRSSRVRTLSKSWRTVLRIASMVMFVRLGVSRFHREDVLTCSNMLSSWSQVGLKLVSSWSVAGLVVHAEPRLTGARSTPPVGDGACEVGRHSGRNSGGTEARDCRHRSMLLASEGASSTAGGAS